MNMTRCTQIAAADPLPTIDYEPDNIQLFFHNAALWNAHRIHFDQDYAQNVEEYPKLVVPGPLLGDWLSQCVIEWLGDDGRLVSIEYSNRPASFVGDHLVAGGEVVDVNSDTGRCEVTLFVKNTAGEVITPGTAVVEFSS